MVRNCCIVLGFLFSVLALVPESAFGDCVSGLTGPDYNIAVPCDDGSWGSDDSWSDPYWEEPEDYSFESSAPTMTPDERRGLLLAQEGYAAWSAADEERAFLLYTEAYGLFPGNDSIREGFCAISNNRALSLAYSQASPQLGIHLAEQAQMHCPGTPLYAETASEIRSYLDRIASHERSKLMDASLHERVSFYVQELEMHMEQMTKPPDGFDFMLPGSSLFSKGTNTAALVKASQPAGGELPSHIANSVSPKAEIILDALEIGKGDWWTSVRYLESMLEQWPGNEHIANAYNYVRGVSAEQRALNDVTNTDMLGLSYEEFEELFGSPYLPARNDPDAELSHDLIELLFATDPTAITPLDNDILNNLVQDELDRGLLEYEEQVIREWASKGLDAVGDGDYTLAVEIFSQLTETFPDDPNLRDTASYVEGLRDADLQTQ